MGSRMDRVADLYLDMQSEPEFLPIDKQPDDDVMHMIDLEKQIVLRANRLIRVRRARCLRSIFCMLRLSG
jgi:hypothetical protein